MIPTLFTAAGCARCNIARKFLQARRIAFEEHDALSGGKERFAHFYRAHRNVVVRGKEGVEFPLFVHGDVIRQGVAAIVAYLHAGRALDEFIGRSAHIKNWVGGIYLSAGDPAAVHELETVLVFLKGSGLKLRLDTDGRNPSVLEYLHAQAIGDRVVMDLKGPQGLYGTLLGCAVDPSDISRSMVAASTFPDRRFETRVAPLADPAGGLRYMTPEEIGAAAHWLKEATGSPKQPYFLKWFNPANCADESLGSVEALAPEALFRYRTAARRHQLSTEIANDPD
jgi:pyruvate formate lyase activating enzyme